ncbi:Uncharacterised protein [Burkholderia pseudomallei]|uniref:hypothetical protein n=1 Tax=Burkholderia pseudomallei TaxID=28450 RepID=UPI001AD6192E|nr:hypothetical protein [Burkholderia pseudomallei]MBO7774167.1 hypothetical protein [Burkholderia pseudomallei]MBO7907058.1 hypothetical protein [Burkholderia pseudomallei]CAJ4328815.1 Uncharacterised protein [Burkholderia pseudomallei]CAJ6033186.1 Uncharacterised protein [Burkholderia pseudomallei]
MTSNIDRFKGDLAKLIKLGNELHMSMRLSCFPDEFKAQLKKRLKDKTDEFIKSLPSFDTEYQRWYSEALALLRQVLPDRVGDFCRHYEKPKTRKDIAYDNYTIEDYLQGLNVTRGIYKDKVVGRDAAIPHFRQQLAIVDAVQGRFESSLFDIRHMVQADLLDSELEAAEHLAKVKFFRAAGAVAGVVLERHLGEVCADRKITIGKKNPTISDFNEALKAGSVIDIPQWRFIQHLGDIRNICDHAKTPDPTPEQVTDLLAGVKKIIKTVY